tara:strand:- start:462 stop:827 length:366 start_codon:yes stop_codon:yes gene_type:complete
MTELIKEIIKRDGLDKKCRNASRINKRRYICSLLHKKGHHCSDIGKLFNLDRTTIIYSIKKYDELIEVKDKMLQVDIEEYQRLFSDLPPLKHNWRKDVVSANTLEDLTIIKLRLKNNLYDN